MRKCDCCHRTTNDPDQQVCLGCGGVEFTVVDKAPAAIVPAASTPKAAIVPTVSSPKAKAPRQQVEEEETKDSWYTSIPAMILWWIIGCFGVYLLWVYAMPHFWGWAMITGEYLLVHGFGWIVGGWWATPLRFFQVIIFMVMVVVVLLAWLVTAIPVIFVLLATVAVAIPLLMLVAGM